VRRPSFRKSGLLLHEFKTVVSMRGPAHLWRGGKFIHLMRQIEWRGRSHLRAGWPTDSTEMGTAKMSILGASGGNCAACSMKVLHLL
jgi:hypothetical protein